MGSMILLQLYLQHARGACPLLTGLLVMPGGLAMGALGPAIGRIYRVAVTAQQELVDAHV
jgi:DHA2 family lincomycin resistance protein-like MFS transporter